MTTTRSFCIPNELLNFYSLPNLKNSLFLHDFPTLLPIHLHYYVTYCNFCQINLNAWIELRITFSHFHLIYWFATTPWLSSDWCWMLKDYIGLSKFIVLYLVLVVFLWMWYKEYSFCKWCVKHFLLCLALTNLCVQKVFMQNLSVLLYWVKIV